MTDPIDTVEVTGDMVNFATITARFFKTLTEAGLGREEALVLTNTWLDGIVKGKHGQ